MSDPPVSTTSALEVDGLCPLSRQAGPASHSTSAESVNHSKDCPLPSVDEQQPRASFETYASTIASENDDKCEIVAMDVTNVASTSCPGLPRASSPSEFALFFPSTRTMSIKHDDATLDGNMNLRVTTEADLVDGSQVDLTLFHLRMYDLRKREFSLRRYCRDSGREVCQSKRNLSKPARTGRSSLKRTVSNAILSLRPRSDRGSIGSRDSWAQDSGYDTMSDKEVDLSSAPSIKSAEGDTGGSSPTLSLDFSNYAHVDVTRSGLKSSKRYDFYYWGNHYVWRRTIKSCGTTKEASYHLIDMKSDAAIAHIVPLPMSCSKKEQEAANGG